MKTLILAGMLMAASVAQGATEEQERNALCFGYGTLFENTAAIRDDGRSPENALAQSSVLSKIPLEARKKAINLVYFDPAFRGAGGKALAFQIIETCMYGPKKQFEPLK